MRRLLILIITFLMIVFNGFAFNVLEGSHSHDEVEKTEDTEMHDEKSVNMDQHTPDSDMTDDEMEGHQ